MHASASSVPTSRWLFPENDSRCLTFDRVGYPTRVTDEWAESASTWDENPAVRLYAQEAHASLKEILEQEGVTLGECDVLDFGCGTGLLTEALVPEVRTIAGFDSSPAMIERFRTKAENAGWPNVRVETGPLPETDRFHLIVASSVLGFVPDLNAMVELLASHLHAGGLLVQWDWEAKEEGADGLTRDAIRAAYAAAGLELRALEVGFEVEVDGYTMAPLVGVAKKA